MSLYPKLAATAERLIAKYGRAALLRRTTAGAYSPATNSHAGGSSVDHPIKAVFSDFTDKEIEDTESIQRGDRKVLLSARVQPLKDDVLIDGDDQRFTVLDVKTIKPGPIVVLYKIQARK